MLNFLKMTLKTYSNIIKTKKNGYEFELFKKPHLN